MVLEAQLDNSQLSAEDLHTCANEIRFWIFLPHLERFPEDEPSDMQEVHMNSCKNEGDS